MSWPIAAARSHRPARRRPAPHPPPHVPSQKNPKPTAPARFGASRVLPTTHPREALHASEGVIAIPRERRFTGRHVHIRGQGLCQRALVSGGFLQAGSQAGGLQSPAQGCLSLLAQSSPPAPAPVPAGRHQR